MPPNASPRLRVVTLTVTVPADVSQVDLRLNLPAVERVASHQEQARAGAVPRRGSRRVHLDEITV
jgi:hypothetical protein